MAFHAKDALCSSRITKVLDHPLAVAAFEAVCAKSLITSQNSQILYLIAAITTAVCAVIAYE